MNLFSVFVDQIYALINGTSTILIHLLYILELLIIFTHIEPVEFFFYTQRSGF